MTQSLRPDFYHYVRGIIKIESRFLLFINRMTLFFTIQFPFPASEWGNV